MKRPLIADLFCGAGGAAMGLHRAGFDVVGFDIEPQPRYPFAFVRQDALTVDLSGFDAVWASPPCQWITLAAIQWRANGRNYPELVEPTRILILRSAKPYVIEQPVGQPLRDPIMLNGSTFGRRVKRNRYFETSFPLAQPLLVQDGPVRKMGRPWDARKGDYFYPVGHFSGVEAARGEMGIGWMTRQELSQAVLPDQAEYLGRQLLRGLEAG